MSTVIRGSCHCAALAYELQWPESAAEGMPLKIPGRRCSCSFCTRFDGVWTSHPEASLTLSEDPEYPASAYRFGTGTADFLFCGRCGITPLVMCDIDGQSYAVVNVNTFDQTRENVFEIEKSDACFDGESTGKRLDRRKARWIGSIKRKKRVL